MSKERVPVRYWSEYLPTLKQKGVNEALSSVFFRSAPLNRWIRRKLSEGFQSGESLAADPVFESVFGWKESSSTYGGLVKRGLLLEETLQAVNRPNAPKIDPKWKVYQHQLEAFEALGDKKHCNSIIVSSGTGSGKTECFMLPLLNDLAQEIPPGAKPSRGIRALFLYPLNALIESQQERLSNWTKPFNGRIKYCRYNGNTPEVPPSSPGSPEEVRDRKTLRKIVPQMLLSNPSMIERMLMRDEDRPILETTRKNRCFRWVIIDEAHTYIGTKAADLALLLRRVMNAFGADPTQVHFVATSATVDASDEKAKQALKDFLTDLSGSRPEQIHLILGERKRPADIAVADDNGLSIAELLSIADQDYNNKNNDYPELKKALLNNRQAMQIRSYFIANQRARLSKLQEVFNVSNPVEMLQWLDVLTAVPDLLPLRLHQFLNSTGLLYACPDSNCSCKDLEFSDKEWLFGNVYFEGHTHCDCGAPLFPIAACSHCNSVTLKAELDLDTSQIFPPNSTREDERLWRFIEETGQNDASEIINPIKSTAEASDSQTDNEVSDTSRDTASEISDESSDEPVEALNSSSTISVHISNTTNAPMSMSVEWEKDGENHTCSVGIIPQETNDKGETTIRCAACDSDLLPSKYYLRRVSTRYFQMLLPYLVEHGLTDADNSIFRPMDGRRLISFTDSRQGTAKTSALIEREGERSYVMSFLYQQLLKGNQTSTEKIAQFNELKRIYEQTKASVILNAMEALRPKPEVSWTELIDALKKSLSETQKSTMHQLVHSMWKTNDLGPDYARETAEILVLREFHSRPVNGRNVETCGLVSLHYTALDSIPESKVPPLWKEKKFTLDDWKNYLKHCIDFFVRPQHCLPFPGEWHVHGGNRMVYKHIIVRPDADSPKQPQIRWPQIYPKYQKRASRFLRYTAGLLGYGTDGERYTHDEIEDTNQLLRAAYETLTTCGQLMAIEGGHVLNLEKVAFKLNKEAWLFDNNRLYDAVVGKESRTLCPEDLNSSKAQKVEIPWVDISYDAWCTQREASREKVREQLRNNPAYEEAVMNGRWSALATHTLENTGYFSAAEHTAQLDKDTRTNFTEDFKKGFINVLNCSTTMEMGVDLSDINTVVMNNVPPHPANYLQRAGRAGRRNETRANTFTLCGSTPRDRHVFNHPDWALTERQPQMQVALTSAQLVQRHVNAQLLSDFFDIGRVESRVKLTVASWLDGLGERYQSWLKKLTSDAVPTTIADKLENITRRSTLSQRPTQQLIQNSLDKITEITRFWQSRRKLYNLRLAELKDRDQRAANAVNYQLLAFTSRPIYDGLTQDLYLPSTIYITNVVQFNNLSEFIEDILFQKSAPQRKKVTFRDLPSRDAAVGIYEYAPGSSVVIDNEVFESAGIERTWITPEKGSKVQIDEMRRYCDCNICGEVSLLGTEAVAICSNCGNPINNPIPAIIPQKFCVSRNNTPHNDISRLVSFPRQEDKIHLDADWGFIGREKNAVAIRSSTEASVISHNPGRDNHGFNVCLACGWARPAESDEDDVQHYPVRSINPIFTTDDGHCIGGTADSYLLKRNIFLASEFKTDCLQVQFPVSKKFSDTRSRSAGLGLAIVLRRAVAHHYGIEEDELGFAYQSLFGRLIVSVYDKKMSGYTSGLGNSVVSVLMEARSYLNCPNQCTASCPACLQTFDSRSKERELDRHDALTVFSESVLASLTVDSDHRNFAGDDSEYLAYGMRTHIEDELNQEKAKQVVLRLSRPADDFDLYSCDLSAYVSELCSQNLGSLVTLQAVDFDWDQLPEDCFSSLKYWENCGVHFSKETGRVPEKAAYLSAVLALSDGTFRGIALDCEHSEDLRAHWQFESANPDAAPTQAYIGRVGGIPSADPCEAPSIKTTVVQKVTNAAHILPALDFNLMTFRNFGERLLQAAARAHGEASFEDLLDNQVKKATLTSVTFTDRYLVRAMDPVLVLSIFRVLRNIAGTESTDFVIKTRSSNQSGNDPYKIRNYWRDDVSKEDTLSVIAAQVKQGKCGWLPASLHFYIEDELPHERRLTLTFGSGEKYVLQLDRGVGFVNANGVIPSIVRSNRTKPYEVNLAQYLLRLTTSTKARDEEQVFCSEQTSIFSWFEK